jgi:hypothetical protein
MPARRVRSYKPSNEGDILHLQQSNCRAPIPIAPVGQTWSRNHGRPVAGAMRLAATATPRRVPGAPGGPILPSRRLNGYVSLHRMLVARSCPGRHGDGAACDSTVDGVGRVSRRRSTRRQRSCRTIARATLRLTRRCAMKPAAHSQSRSGPPEVASLAPVGETDLVCDAREPRRACPLHPWPGESQRCLAGQPVDSFTYSFLVQTTVPEPSPWMLVLSGGIAALFPRARRVFHTLRRRT